MVVFAWDVRDLHVYFFREHQVLPMSVECPRCHKQLVYWENLGSSILILGYLSLRLTSVVGVVM